MILFNWSSAGTEVSRDNYIDARGTAVATSFLSQFSFVNVFTLNELSISVSYDAL